MNIKHLLFLFFLLLSINSDAKKNDKQATVTGLSGDSYRVTVVDKDWDRNPAVFNILTSAGESKVLRPSQITSLKIDSGDFYLSAYVPIDMNYIQSLETDDGVIHTVETDSIFLRVMVEAPLSLYFFKDRNGKEHFLVKKNNEPFEELIDKNYKMFHEGRYILRTVSTYKQRLEKYMQDCKSCLEEIPKTDYSEKKLLKLFLKYNQSLFSNITYVGAYTPSKLRFAAVVGVDMTTFDIEGTSSSSHIEIADFSNSSKPTIGVRLIIPFARLHDRQSVFFDLSWREYETDASYSYNYYDYDVHFYMKYLRLSPGYCYKFTNTKLRPYLSVGISFGYLVSCENVKHQVDNNPLLPPTYDRETTGEAFVDPYEFDLGINGIAGLQYKNLFLELKLETFTGFITTNSLKAKVNSTCALLGYRF